MLSSQDFCRANNVDLDAVSIHGDDELDDIDKEIKGLSEGAAESSKKTPQKGTFLKMFCWAILETYSTTQKLPLYSQSMLESRIV